MVATTNNRWYDVAGTWDGTTVLAYSNGRNDSPFGQEGTGSGAIAGSAVNIGIGYNPAYNGDFFNGLIQDVMFWNRTLSQAELFELYSDPTGFLMPDETSLQGLSTFQVLSFSKQGNIKVLQQQ